MRVLVFSVSLLLFAGMAAADDDWYPSRYGADDTLGALNLLSPDKVLRAARLITTGKTYALGIETSRDTPAFGSRTSQVVVVQGSPVGGGSLGKNKATYLDDILYSWVGVGTQIDGLGHLGIDHRYYNGTHVTEIFNDGGLKKFAIDQLPPIVGRGVLLNIAALKKRKMLKGGYVITRADLEAAQQRQGVALEEGDIVITHTGWAPMAQKDPAKFLATEPGIGAEAAEYLAERGAVAVGSDGWALEVLPGEDPDIAFPVHQILLAKHGVYILESIRTDQLVADDVSEFLFVLGPARFKGAVQGVINPIAIR